MLKKCFLDKDIFSDEDLFNALVKNGYRFKYRGRKASDTFENVTRGQMWNVLMGQESENDVTYKEHTTAKKKS